jgi:hypothetical protein
MIAALSAMSDKQILHVMKSVTAKFVVYKHKGSDQEIYGWKTNKLVAGVPSAESESDIEVFTYVDDMKVAIDVVNMMSDTNTRAQFDMLKVLMSLGRAVYASPVTRVIHK